MRKLVIATLAALTFGLFGAPTSADAAASWKCTGPYVACGGKSAKRAYKGYKTKSYKKKYTSKKKYNKKKKYFSKKKYKKKKVAYKKSRKNRASKKRYSGGGALRGKASYYWQPQRVASGGWFNPNAMTAAHKSLPFGTRVRVTNLRNGRSVVVRINDRGPYIKGRIIDLSRAAAGKIGMRKAGVVPVSVKILGRGKKKG